MLRSNVIEREQYGDRRSRMEAVLSRQRARGLPPRRRHSSAIARRLAGLALAIGFAGFLVALGLAAVSAPATAERILGRAIPTFTEQDSLLALHLPEVRATAAGAGASRVPLPWFPVAVSLPAPLLASGPTQSIQLAIDQQAAQALYERGEAAFGTGSTRPSVTGPLLSPTWTLRQALSLLNAATHARLEAVTGLLGLIVVALALLYSLQAGGPRWVAGLGMAAIAGALAAGLASLFLWLLVQFNSAGAPSPLGDAAWGIWSDVSWTLLMVDSVAVLGGIAVLLTGLVLARFTRAAGERSAAGARPIDAAAAGTAGSEARLRPLDRLPRVRSRLD